MSQFVMEKQLDEHKCFHKMQSMCCYVFILYHFSEKLKYRCVSAKKTRNSIANALELRLSYTNPSIYRFSFQDGQIMSVVERSPILQRDDRRFRVRYMEMEILLKQPTATQGMILYCNIYKGFVFTSACLHPIRRLSLYDFDE